MAEAVVRRIRSASPQSFSFAVIGDSGAGSAAQYAVANQLAAFDPQFVLHTGDVIYLAGQSSGYDPFFFKPYRAVAQRAPVFPTLGNHDHGTQCGQPRKFVSYHQAMYSSGPHGYESWVEEW